MASEYTTTRTVEFSETDMAGIVHFSNFFRYMEATEHQFFRSLGFVLHREDGDPAAGTSLGWARVSASCEYFAPLHYLDQVEIRLCVREKSSRSLGYEFEFHRLEEDGGSAGPAVARGRLRVVCITKSPGQPMRAREMPAEIAAAIEVAPEDAPAREPGRAGPPAS
jgi:YbgC/YbaW family acyl-CoA thioester hydrolase